MNNTILGDQINLSEAMQHSVNQRLDLPLLFLQIPPDSNVHIS